MQDCFIPVFKVILLGASQQVFQGFLHLPAIYLVLAWGGGAASAGPGSPLPSHFHQHQKAYHQSGDIISPVCCRRKFNFHQRLLILWSVKKGQSEVFHGERNRTLIGHSTPFVKHGGENLLVWGHCWVLVLGLVSVWEGGTAQVNPTEVLLKQAVHARNPNLPRYPWAR